MRTTTGIALLAAGAFLTFAVNVHPGFISLQIAGLVLIVTGITGLCMRQRGTGSLRRNLALLRDLVEQDLSMDDGPRVPLEDLLGSASLLGSSRPLGSPVPEPAQRLPQPGEIAIDDAPTLPDIRGSGRVPGPAVHVCVSERGRG